MLDEGFELDEVLSCLSPLRLISLINEVIEVGVFTFQVYDAASIFDYFRKAHLGCRDLRWRDGLLVSLLVELLNLLLKLLGLLLPLFYRRYLMFEFRGRHVVLVRMGHLICQMRQLGPSHF